jgi:hypothetical protein
MRSIPALVTGLFVLLTQGCAPKATFELAITNQSDRPITVGVVKDGPPYERDLAGPDQWAIESPLDSLPAWGHVVPPGRTMDSGKITGAFPQGTTPYLRVYRGHYSNAQLIAISSPSPDRLEILLFPGYNELVIQNDPDKGLNFKRLRPVPR